MSVEVTVQRSISVLHMNSINMKPSTKKKAPTQLQLRPIENIPE